MDQALAMLGRPYTLDLRSIRLEHDRGKVITSIPLMGAIVPREGRYSVQLVDGDTDQASTASVGIGGTLSWVQTEGYEPQFMAFHDHIV